MSADPHDDEQTEAQGAGSWGLAGYEYQIDVSVWLALDLVLASKLAQELVLEPASQEDLEADVEDAIAPGRITSTADIGGYRLIVQAKRRTGDAWTPARIEKLLLHGSDTRPSAAKRLESPSNRYLLVTSAGLNGETRELKVARAGKWPKATALSEGAKKILPAGSAGRVAIAGGKDEERLAFEIERLLTERFRIPKARLQACRIALREEARSRILKAGSGRWRRPELEATIRAFDGYLADSPELEHYVFPTNWDDLRALMKANHAALIVGQSGTGKTMATRKLIEQLRVEIPGLSRVPVNRDPARISADTTPSPVIYDIEDPWGRFDFDPDSRAWNDQLATFFANASHDRMMIATSRLDVAKAGGALDGVKRWIISLESEHYGPSQQRSLYTNRIAGLPRSLQELAAGAERQVLSELSTPLEIQKFFDALPGGDPSKLANPRLYVGEAIKQAHRNSIERTVVEQIEERKDVRAAAVIWAMLKASDRISLPVIRELEDELTGAEPNLDEGVSPLVSFLVAARNLRQVDDTVAYYHPRVEAGIEQVLGRHPIPVRRMLRVLVEALVARDSAGDAWGAMMATRIIAATRRKLSTAVPKISAKAQAGIDDWLQAELLRTGSDFEDTLKLAVDAGSEASNVSELARWLLHRPDSSFQGWLQWGAPERTLQWRDRMRADDAVRRVADRFVRDYIPQGRENYPGTYVSQLQALAGDLTDAFLDAAAQIVGWGYVSSDDVIAEGALQDLDRFEPIVDAAVKVLTPTANEKRDREETWLAITNGEYSEDYAQHLADNDDGYTAGEFLKAFVQHVRQVRGWPYLVGHRHRAHLVDDWFHAIGRQGNNKTPGADEVLAALEAGFAAASFRESDLWEAAARGWDKRYTAWAVRRLGEGDRKSARAAALAALIACDPQALADHCEALSAKGASAALLQLALDLNETKDWRNEDGKRSQEILEAGTKLLPPVYAELSVCARTLDESAPQLSSEARAVLASVPGETTDVRRFRIAVDQHVAMPVDDDVRWLLANADESNLAAEAIDAAIRRGMEPEIRASLDHRFAHVVARAVEATGSSLAAPLPTAILRHVYAKGSPVRRAVARLLIDKTHEDHIPAMLKLARDQWNRNSSSHGEPDDFELASLAVDAFDKFSAIPLDVCEELVRIAVETTDLGLRFDMLQLVGRRGAIDAHRLLFDLATKPGKRGPKIDAASALVASLERVDPSVAGALSATYINEGMERVLSKLLILLTLRGPEEVVVSAANALAPIAKRRVLLLLMVRCALDRDLDLADRISALLPLNHPAVPWALGKGGEMTDDDLADLGSPVSVGEVLHYLGPAEA